MRGQAGVGRAPADEAVDADGAAGGDGAGDGDGAADAPGAGVGVPDDPAPAGAAPRDPSCWVHTTTVTAQDVGVFRFALAVVPTGDVDGDGIGDLMAINPEVFVRPDSQTERVLHNATLLTLSGGGGHALWSVPVMEQEFVVRGTTGRRVEGAPDWVVAGREVWPRVGDTRRPLPEDAPYLCGRLYAVSCCTRDRLWVREATDLGLDLTESDAALAVDADLDGDGVPDVVVGGGTVRRQYPGNPRDCPTGLAAAVSGRTGATLWALPTPLLPGAPDAFSGVPAQPGDDFEYPWVRTVAATSPDVSGDGVPDVLLFSLGDTWQTRGVLVLSGRDGRPLAELAIAQPPPEQPLPGHRTTYVFTRAVARFAVDLDGDGGPEWVYTCQVYSGEGLAAVGDRRIEALSLTGGGVLWRQALDRWGSDRGFGAVSVLGDVDGDGHPDLAVPVRFPRNKRDADEGGFRWHIEIRRGLDGALLHTLEPPPGETFGPWPVSLATAPGAPVRLAVPADLTDVEWRWEAFRDPDDPPPRWSEPYGAVHFYQQCPAEGG